MSTIVSDSSLSVASRSARYVRARVCPGRLIDSTAQWLDHETELIKAEVADLGDDATSERLATIQSEARRQESEALATFGMLTGSDPTIAPLRRALAVWGLTVDDIGLASFHGTSTKANDKNESSCFHAQFEHLGRSKGNACPVVAQKWLTGHPKVRLPCHSPRTWF